MLQLGLVAIVLGQLQGPALEQQLSSEDPAAIARDARAKGDPAQGARIFYRSQMACARCHLAVASNNPLGPDLAKAGKEVTDVYLIESILNPSKVIKPGYETVTIARTDGTTIAGLLAEDRAEAVVLRDPAHDGKLVAIARADVEARSATGPSLMPPGLVNTLASRQEFLDLVRYLREIADGGPARALALRPEASSLRTPELPDYEKSIDHAGMIAGLNDRSIKNGAAIFERVCANCHGTRDKPGSMPTSPRFASSALKNGSDPHAMYRTLTHGFGQMPAQTWMVPKQKYDVIHFIRETFFRRDNPRLYTDADASYLAALPKGNSQGPDPSTIEPWSIMDYGPSLMATLEVGDDGSNFGYKGIAVRLDPGPGGVSRGSHWALYDHDTMRLAGAWSGDRFIDWKGINFDGQHEIHPRIAGLVRFANPNGLGWADPETGRFDDPRPLDRAGHPYGPLPRRQSRFRGLYHLGEKVILSYTVGETSVLEMPGLETKAETPVFVRTLNLGPRPKELIIQVAHDADGVVRLPKPGGRVVALGYDTSASAPGKAPAIEFAGATRVEIASPRSLEMSGASYTVFARVKTRRGGTIFSKTRPDDKWVPDGKALFIRNGKLVFDIGWIGAVESKRKIDDDRWHDVAMTYSHDDGRVTLYVDGQRSGQGMLKPARARRRRRSSRADRLRRARFPRTTKLFPRPDRRRALLRPRP